MRLRSCIWPLLAVGLMLAPLGGSAAAQQPAHAPRMLPDTSAVDRSMTRLIARVATAEPKATVDGAISPDGRQLAFELPDSGSRRLWVLDVESGRRRLLTPRPGMRTHVAWSPAGGQLAYIGAAAYTDGETRVDGLWVVDVASGEERLAYVAPTFGDVYAFTWTPDGRLDFATSFGSAWFSHRVRPDGTGHEKLRPLDWAYPALAVAPDTQTIAYMDAGCGTREQFGMWLRSLATRASRCVVQVKHAHVPIRWSPDGSRVYFLGTPPHDSTQHLYELDVARDQLIRIDDGRGPAQSFSLSADGDVVVAKPAPGDPLGATAPMPVTEFWLVHRPPATVRTAAPPEPSMPAAQTPSSLPLSRVPPLLLDVARHAAVAGPRVAHLWPDLWDAKPQFVLWIPESQTTLLVGDGRAFPGFHAITGDSVPPELQGRLYLGESSAVPPSAFGLPAVRVSQRLWDSLGADAGREQALRHLFHVALTGRADPTLLALEGVDPIDYEFSVRNLRARGTSRSGFAPAAEVKHESPFGGCPDGDGASCRALLMLERRILLAALDAPKREVPELLRLYAGARWTRLMAAVVHFADLDVERRVGVPRGVAARAALLAAGADTTRYLAVLRDSLRAVVLPPRGDRNGYGYAAVLGEALALLLDRLGTSWRSEVQRGASMLDVVSAVAAFDSTAAITQLARAMRRFDYAELRREARAEGDTAQQFRTLAPGPDYHQAAFFGRALRELRRSVPPLVIEFPRAIRGTPQPAPTIRVTAGAGDSLSLSPGWVIYPAPTSVEVRGCGLRLLANGHPLLIDRNAQGSPGFLRLGLYVPPEVLAAVGDRQAPSGLAGSVPANDPYCASLLRGGEPSAAGTSSGEWVAWRVRAPGVSLDLAERMRSLKAVNATSIYPW